MGKLYHGSHIKGLTQLEPHYSTHGKYLYATPYKEIAIIFSKTCGDDLTFTLYRNETSDPWIIVERIPGAFKKMFNTSTSIYTLDDKTFKDIKTGFSELVSEVSVKPESEEHLDNLENTINELEKQGKLKIYRYPHKPELIPIDDSDLIAKEIKAADRLKSPITKQTFQRLIILHPNLMDKINKKMEELNIEAEPYTKDDLVDSFELEVIKQSIYPNNEYYIDSIITSIEEHYPELLPKLKEKLLFTRFSDEEKTNTMFNIIARKHPNIPTDILEKTKALYLMSPNSFANTGASIIILMMAIDFAEERLGLPIDQEILEKSLLLRGAAYKDKSTVSSLISESTELPLFQLDNQKQLSDLYKYKERIKDPQLFEFFLIMNVLTSLKEPSIVDFGNIIDNPENPILYYYIQEIIKKYKHNLTLLPNGNKNSNDGSVDQENSPGIIYINDKKPEELADIITCKLNEEKFDIA